jgi:hypothetical protein
VVLPIATALFLISVVLAADRCRISPVVITVTFLSAILLGYWMLDARAGTSVWTFHALATAAMILGYRVSWIVLSCRGRDTIPATFSRRSVVALRLVSVVVIALAAYHVLASGIPILRSDVEVQRFNFTGSGLFGIPGRMYLYGLPCVVLGTAVVDGKMPHSPVRRLLTINWTAYVVIALLSGFKGGLLSVIVLYALARALSSRPIVLGLRSAFRYAFLIVAAFGFATAVSLRYASIGVANVPAAVEYIGARLTIIPALPGYQAVTELQGGAQAGLYLLDDLYHFASKYFGIDFGGGAFFPLEKVVSSSLYGTSLSDDSFIVPVTVGAAPGFYVDFGLAVALIAMAVMGAVYAYLVRRVGGARTVLGGSLLSLSVYFLSTFLVNGSLVYAVLNLAIVGALLVGTYVACYAVSQVVEGALGFAVEVPVPRQVAAQ